MMESLDPFTVRFVVGCAILIVTGLGWAFCYFGLEPPRDPEIGP